MPERKCGDTNVVPAGGDAIPDLLRRQAVDRYLETWQPATEFGDEAWRETGCHRRQRRNPQRSGSATAKVVRKGTDLRQTDEGSFHLGQESRGFVGRHDQIAASTEQRQAELVFEVANETTDCWLGDLDHLGRGGHGAGQHDRAEGFDLAGLDHGRSIIRQHTLGPKRDGGAGRCPAPLRQRDVSAAMGQGGPVASAVSGRRMDRPVVRR